MVSFVCGYIRIDLPALPASSRSGKVEVFTDKGKCDVPRMAGPQLPWVSAMRKQAADYARAIKGEAPPLRRQPKPWRTSVARDYL
ncbi:MAG: hypothetical protein ACYC4R_06485 [Anaerolineae bacterium]